MDWGYIGLPTALTFANHGIEVVGVDVSETVVQSLQAGQAPIEEPDIDRYLAQALAKKDIQGTVGTRKSGCLYYCRTNAKYRRSIW